MKRLFYNALLLFFSFWAMQITACKKDAGFVHNSSADIIVDSFIPAKGGAGTEVLLYGANFTNNKAEVTVTLNGAACEVVGVNQGNLALKVPAKAGTGHFTVTIQGQTGVSDAVFNYVFTKTVSTVAGNGSQGFSDMVSGTQAGFYFYDRTGLTVDTLGNIYIADCGNHCIRKVDSTGYTTTFSGFKAGEGWVDGPHATAQYNLPSDIEIDNAGNLYVADKWNWHVRKITPDGTASTLSDWVEDPSGIGINKTTGTVYVACAGYKKVYEITPDGKTTALPVSFNYPSDVAVDTDGNLMVVDQGTSTVEKLTYSAGTWVKTIIAGIAGTTGFVDGGPAVATFNNPLGITLDRSNNIYIADYYNNSIRIIDATGTTSTFIGTGSAGYSDGGGSEAKFNQPSSVAFDKYGDMFVLDRGNGYIRKVTIK